MLPKAIIVLRLEKNFLPLALHSFYISRIFAQSKVFFLNEIFFFRNRNLPPIPDSKLFHDF